MFTPHRDEFGEPIGSPLPGWMPPPVPARVRLPGRFCDVVPLDPARHGPALYAANARDPDHRQWTYLPYGPFTSYDAFDAWLRQVAVTDDPLFHAVIDWSSGEALGVAAYLRINPPGGSIEVGHINFSPQLQRTAAATEALHLMFAQAFALGYRRLEWKCDALNARSRAAAQRLGLSFEGVFRQATVYKGRNRDTAWYAAIDQEWPALDRAFHRWLEPSNFDEQGRQRLRLSDLTAPVLARRG